MRTPPVFTGQRPIKPTEPSKPPIPPGLMDTKATAKWLQVSTRFLSEEVSLERIRVVRLNKLVRFDPADVIAYAEARKSGGLAPVLPAKDAPNAAGGHP